ncbi:MAG: hypothetical protein Q6356_002460 [Candidatus Wukongarchaeota archaeon]|nr:hypothetical protein [Candidatus Wukongarchaeota archaeon]
MEAEGFGEAGESLLRQGREDLQHQKNYEGRLLEKPPTLNGVVKHLEITPKVENPEDLPPLRPLIDLPRNANLFIPKPRRTNRTGFGRRLTSHHKKLSKPVHSKNLFPKQIFNNLS